jgi:hypothetical protein
MRRTQSKDLNRLTLGLMLVGPLLFSACRVRHAPNPVAVAEPRHESFRPDAGLDGGAMPAPEARPAAKGPAASSSVQDTVIQDEPKQGKAGAKPAQHLTASEDSAEIPARDRAPGSTLDTIACGRVRCQSKAEKCLLQDNQWRCVPATAGDPEGSYACDDASDCAPGRACCRSFASAAEWYVCSVRSGSGSDCRQEICTPGGTPCPEGQQCREGECHAPVRATCGSAGHCAEPTPYCRWTNTAGRCIGIHEARTATEEMIRAAPESIAHSILACTRPADCGPGAACCTSAVFGLRLTFCATQCDPAMSVELCASDRDCPLLGERTDLGSRGKCRPVAEVEPTHARFTPPGTKLCQWGTDPNE